MPASLVTIAYIAAGMLFILSLGGLSAQTSARRGNLFGMIGMAAAVLFTAFGPGVSNYPLLLATLVAGGAIGAALAARVQMTAMPQLVAILHSFVGLAAVLVGFSSYLRPVVPAPDALRHTVHLVEIWVGIAVGSGIGASPHAATSGRRWLRCRQGWLTAKALAAGSAAAGLRGHLAAQTAPALRPGNRRCPLQDRQPPQQ